MLTAPKPPTNADALVLRRFAALMRQARDIVGRARATMPSTPPGRRVKVAEWCEATTACQEAEYRLAGLLDPLVKVTAWIETEAEGKAG